jgi:hypothetical protein
MKNIPALFLLSCVFCSACTKLDVPVESQYNSSNFPSTTASYAAAIGPLYSQLAYSTQGFSYAVDYWRLQELSTDEAIIPARDGNYDDGGQYRFLHKHTWTSDHPNVKSNWEWGFGGINASNRLINLFSVAPDNPTKPAAIAEVKTMRSLYYFLMMDLYGNIPIIDTFPVATLPQTTPRAKVFEFIESNLKASLPNLTSRVDATTYGRATKWLAFALLEKLYLNAEYYTGTPRYAFGLVTQLQAKYSIPFRPSVALSTIPDFYAFFNLPGDVRNATWLVGKQYNFDGTPLLFSTTRKSLDQKYVGQDGPIQWHVEIAPELTLVNVSTMDVGNDILGQCKGVRSVKFYPDRNANPSTRYQNNDMPMFRLADVILMKAEAILRGAAPTTVKGEMQTPTVLMNKIRTRVKAPQVTTVTLQALLDERARELAWEGWRRNDLIRFGQYEKAWGFKTATTEVSRRIFPVPAVELALNANLKQNPGY